MRRLNILEIEDLPFTPGWLRDLLTDFLSHLASEVKLYEPVRPLLERLLESGGTRNVVDLCSGAGGPWRSLLEPDWNVEVTLTDLRPHAQRLQPDGDQPRLRYELNPVDALRVPRRLAGARTLFSGLHHLSDTEVRSLLENAMVERCPIGAFEFVERSPRRLLADALFAPLLVLLLTPKIRPLQLRRFFCTYIVPLVPLVVLWDGLASDLRARTTSELKALVQPLRSSEYDWEVGSAESPRARARITYVLGMPRTAAPLGKHAAQRESETAHVPSEASRVSSSDSAARTR